ncbi:SDR family oxidoreductase [Microlunatus panaciterrae]|uniref:Nucleoside-diphosphate-sugar epimerase n=1 Tax=Microlunatus panaciterrae TaxID=400768 RepID=A0ABS2RLX7_9ACTN|nr:SDR family oxidoreductase [Microlunatus panaciterrae]MBM7800009.1 nucleoside-diphosphate-sugar epimerase [Microlunatus panaciterrae]
MSPLKILFIGGTGTISAASSAQTIAAGHQLTLLNRGTTASRPVPAGAEVLTADIRDPASVRSALGAREFDVVVDFIAFTPDHVRTDIDLFTSRTSQYVFISSASAYQKPVARLPIVESTPLRNPYWQYSRDKIACEDLLLEAYRDDGFPITIVRPSSTYDHSRVALPGGWTVVDRMRRGLPVVVHGDGTSLWTMTHTEDFAIGFVGLLGHPQAIGDSFHITSDEVLTWNHIFGLYGTALGVTPQLVHVASDTLAAVLPEIGPGIVGDKAHSVIFDNSKIKSLVPEFCATIPYATGVREIVGWHDEHPDAQVVDAGLNARLDALIDKVQSLGN